MSHYRYGLGFTSQFFFCALPLRLDTYSTCPFSCAYCFARARGGARGVRGLQVFDVDGLQRRLARLAHSQPCSAVDEWLQKRLPLHLGGMADPFPNDELLARVTLATLIVLGAHRYPTVVSTKGTVLLRDEYLAALARGCFVVQFSICTIDRRLARSLQPGAPSPRELLRAMRTLADAGVPVVGRLQPLLPVSKGHALESIQALVEAGARHIITEHLKLSVERTWGGRSAVARALGATMAKYQTDGSRVGREWILPTADRLERVLQMRSYLTPRGVTLGVADNDLSLFSDTADCCGLDLFRGFERAFDATYTSVARASIRSGLVRADALRERWMPQRSVRMYVNSHSRRPRARTLHEFLLENWNGSEHGFSPSSIFGIARTRERDSHGFQVYRVDPRLEGLLQASGVAWYTRRDNTASHPL